MTRLFWKLLCFLPLLGVATQVHAQSTYGTAQISADGVTCSGILGVTLPCSGTLHITAVGGPVVLAAEPATLRGTHASAFTISPGSCAGAALEPGASCELGPLLFTPSTSSTNYLSIYSNPVSGATSYRNVSAYAWSVATTSFISVNNVTCPTAGIGVPASCQGQVITLRSASGGLILGEVPFEVSGATSEFVYRTPTTNPCQPHQILMNDSCNLIEILEFTPAEAGTRSMTVTVSPTVGPIKTATVSGTGKYGKAVLSPSQISCAGKNGETIVCADEITVTASEGLIVLGSNLFSVNGSDRSYFSVGTAVSDACVPGQVLPNGASCKLGPLMYQVSGNRTATITVQPANGSSGSANVSGFSIGRAKVSNNLNCGNAGVGTSRSCSLTVTVVAENGNITFGEQLYEVTGATTEFSIQPPTGGSTVCQPRQVLSNGVSCNLVRITEFKPLELGQRVLTITVTPAEGDSGSGTVYGNGTYGKAVVNTASVSCIGVLKQPVTCSGEITVTATDGPIVLGQTLVSMGGAYWSAFQVAATVDGACIPGQQLANGESCKLGPITFTAGSGLTHTASVTVFPAYGSPGTGYISGTVIGAAEIVGISCGDVPIGQTGACSGTVKVRAKDGNIRLGPVTYTLEGMTDEFEFAPAASGACQANQVLTTNQTCNLLRVTAFTPATEGQRSMTIHVTPEEGLAGSGTVSGNGVYGRVAVSASELSCSGAVGTSSACDGAVTVTATNGSVVLGSTLFSITGVDASAFSIGNETPDACSAGQTLHTGESCTLGPITFSPTKVGTHSAKITVTPDKGQAGSASLSGDGYTYGAASVRTVSCGNVGIGTTGECHGNVRVFAASGSIQLGSELYTLSGSLDEFEFGPPTTNPCQPNQVLAHGNSCNLFTVFSFTPADEGTRALQVTVTPAVGKSGTNAITGVGVYGKAEVSTSELSCSGEVATTTTCTGDITVTAVGGRIILSSSLFTLSGDQASEFSIGTTVADACVPGQRLEANSACKLGPVTFAPKGAGVRTARLRVDPSQGGSHAVQISGTAVELSGTAELDASAVNCVGAVGEVSTCSGVARITAKNGPIVLQTPPVVVTGAHADEFAVAAGQCGGAELAAGESCTLGAITFTPKGTGTRTATIAANVAYGKEGSTTISVVVPEGTLVVAPSSLDCGSAEVGQSANCGSFTVTARGGPVRLGSPAITNSATGDFTVPLGACTSDKLLADGESCTTGMITFTPQKAGAASSTVQVHTVAGLASTVTLNGLGVATEVQVSPSALDCGATDVGESISCGSVTITAVGGPITFGVPPFTVTEDFTITPGECTEGRTLAAGQSCKTGAVIFTPQRSGPVTGTLTVHCGEDCEATISLKGIGDAFTYGWKAGEWNAWDSTCSASATRTRDVYCERSDGTMVADDKCDAASRPVDSETAEILTGCTYSWEESGFGDCQGGSGSWVTGEWQPQRACGEVEQTRSVTCVFDANSGVQTQMVACRRSDGELRPDAECDASTRPPAVQSCTPSDPAVCGVAPERSRTVTLENGCVSDVIRKSCKEGAFCLLLPL